MRYDIRLLPDVEEDVVAGYRWYEGKAPADWVKSSCGCSTLAWMELSGILSFHLRSIMKFDVSLLFKVARNYCQLTQPSVG